MRHAWVFVLVMGCANEATTAAPDAAASADASLNADAGASEDANRGDAGAPSGDVLPAEMTLESAAFARDGTLPVAYTCDGAGRSPPLAWRGAPAGTVSFALMMTVLARDGLKWNWVLYDIPATVNALSEATTGVGTAGLTSDGPNLAYSPPCSQGPGPMRYTFTLYALSARPMLPPVARMVTGSVLTSAIAGITLARAAIAVTYTR